MIPATDKESEWLATLREEMSPNPSDFVRVREGVALAVSTMGLAPSSDFAELMEFTDPHRRTSFVARIYASKIALGGLIAIVGFGGGFMSGRATATHHNEVITSAKVLPVEAKKAEFVDNVIETKDVSKDVIPVKRPNVVTPPLTKPASVPAPAPVPAASSSTSNIGDEARELRRAERAMRTGMPSLALGILSELDQRIPHGVLLEERGAARLMARCGIEEPGAPKAAREWLTHHKQSVYAARLRAACGITTEENHL